MKYTWTFTIKIAAFAFMVSAFIAFSANAQILSPDAQVRVYTAGPGNELYSVFGHSAIRVTDPVSGIDRVYNYGTFDFSTSNFYLKFIRGKLLYMLSVSDFASFQYPYVAERRYLYEQVLNLDREQKQAVFDFLEENYLPANRFYAYDFFFDNCSTRIRDVLEVALGEQISFSYTFEGGQRSFRDLIDPYLANKPWADLGIDLGLGLPTDQIAAPREYLFLPDYLFEAISHATITINGQQQALVSQTNHLFDASIEVEKPMVTPSIVMWILFLLVVGITFRDIRRRDFFYEMDVLLFGTVGLISAVLLFLWLATDHQATRPNLNILWAWPTHLGIWLWVIRLKAPWWLCRYFQVYGIAMVLLLVAWPFLGQDLHEAFMPLIMALIIRSMFIGFLNPDIRQPVQKQLSAQ